MACLARDDKPGICDARVAVALPDRGNFAHHRACRPRGRCLFIRSQAARSFAHPAGDSSGGTSSSLGTGRLAFYCTVGTDDVHCPRHRICDKPRLSAKTCSIGGRGGQCDSISPPHLSNSSRLGSWRARASRSQGCRDPIAVALERRDYLRPSAGVSLNTTSSLSSPLRQVSVW
jgi:hypothetical protein